MKTSTSVNIPPTTVCLWLAGTLCLPVGILHAVNPDAPPVPTPIPITIVEARLETREVPSKPAKFSCMAALPGFAVLTTGRSLFILQAGKDTPEPAASLLRIPEGIDYFGYTREAGGSIFIEVGEYDEEQRSKEAGTPRGGFVSGPTSKGLLIITDSPPAVRWIKRCRVTRWPEDPDTPKEYASHAPKWIVPDMQDMRVIGGKLHLGSYGMLGILDLAKEEWYGLEIDPGMAYSRVGPVMGPEATLFVGVDEGGLSGGWVKWTRGTRSGEIFLQPAHFPHDMLALGNRVFVATDHGLAEITEPAAEPLARHFIDRASGKNPMGRPTTFLLTHGKTLLAVAGDRILQLDPDPSKATLHHLSVKKPIMSICRFDGHYYGIGPGPLVRFDLP